MLSMVTQTLRSPTARLRSAGRGGWIVEGVGRRLIVREQITTHPGEAYLE